MSTAVARCHDSAVGHHIGIVHRPCVRMTPVPHEAEGAGRPDPTTRIENSAEKRGVLSLRQRWETDVLQGLTFCHDGGTGHERRPSFIVIRSVQQDILCSIESDIVALLADDIGSRLVHRRQLLKQIVRSVVVVIIHFCEHRGARFPHNTVVALPQ